jgi:hypothetical protein
MRIRWAAQTVQMGMERNAYRMFVGKPEEKAPLGRPRYRWVDNIKMDLRDIEVDGIGWTDLVQDRAKWEAPFNMTMNVQA